MGKAVLTPSEGGRHIIGLEVTPVSGARPRLLAE